MRRIAIGSALAAFAAAIFVVGAGTLLSRPFQEHIGPAPADLAARNVTFPSGSGALIHGWLSTVPDSSCVVLLLPGVRANRISTIDRARFLHQAGYSTLQIDFQGTGETRGEHITFGWLESRDVLASVDYLRRELPSKKVAVIGTSLGGAAALIATPPLRADALVVEAVYPTIEQATENRLKIYFGPLASIGRPLLMTQLKPRIGISSNDLRPIDHIGRVGCPLFVIGGEKDRHTPPGETRALFVRAQQPKEMWIVPGAGHVDFQRHDRAEYERRVLAFLKAAIRSQP